jgi:hypothetical protein
MSAKPEKIRVSIQECISFTERPAWNCPWITVSDSTKPNTRIIGAGLSFEVLYLNNENKWRPATLQPQYIGDLSVRNEMAPHTYTSWSFHRRTQGRLSCLNSETSIFVLSHSHHVISGTDLAFSGRSLLKKALYLRY